MSVYILKCQDCNHTSYDIVVLCTGGKVDDTCPKCGSSNLKTAKLEKPKDKFWAEEEGCHHGDPSKFLLGSKKDKKKSPGACGPGGSCSCHGGPEKKNLTLDEEIDQRLNSISSDLKNLVLPNKLVKELKKPWGKVLEKVPLISKSKPLFTIGDITTQNFMKKLYLPNLAVVDHLVNRKPIPKEQYTKEDLFEHCFFIPNPSGQITRRVYQVIERLNFSEHSLIHIDGEEDLITLVCILHAPMGSNIFYGQPDQGLVHIEVDKKIKEKAENLFSQFEER